MFGQQGDVNSPFSRFGIGNINDRGGMHLRQMGGLGNSYFDSYHLNFENPATLAFLKATAFDIGLQMQRTRLSDNDGSSIQWSGNMAYLSLGFPLRNPLNEANDQVFGNQKFNFSWGMGFNITPISTISYDITEVDNLENIGTFNRNFSGNGGFWKATWGTGVKYKNFALGTNLGFLFGKNEFSRSIDFIDELTAFDNIFSREYTARGFYWDIGALYSIYLNESDLLNTSTITEPRILTIGLTGKSATGINLESDINEVNILVASAFDLLVDTVNISSGIQGDGTMPGELGFGATYYHENKFALGFDFKRTFWSQYTNDANPEQLDNTTRMALGGYFRPDYRSNESFLKRISYRFGVYMEDDPRTIENERIDNFGVTFGIGLPFAWQRKISNLNLGVNLGRRSIDNILSETFIKMHLGFTFNDNEWFIKRKYN